MQAIILAAGKGARLGAITRETPKPLVKIRGKPILEHTLASLPSCITEAIVIVNHLSEKIRSHLGDGFGKLPLRYIEQTDMPGTAGALWAARDMLRDPFLVLNGDDFYETSELEALIAETPAMGLTEHIAPNVKYLAIECAASGAISGFRKAFEGELILLVNGAYALDGRIFSYPPKAIANGEYGLPQTILEMAKISAVRGFAMRYWYSVNYPQDIGRAKNALIRNKKITDP